MSKEKKVKEVEVVKEKSDVEKVMELIEKDYGENIMVSAKSILDAEPEIIPVSPAADLGLGGGIPAGSWVTLAGKYKCGKMQPLYSKILTPNGYTTFKDIKVGQDICGIRGEINKVLAIFDHRNKDVFRVKFDNKHN